MGQLNPLGGGASLEAMAAGVVQAAFSPADITGLRGWESDYGTYQERTGASATTPATANTDPIGTWANKYGTATYLVNDGDTKRPLYTTSVLNSLPVARFDGSNDWLKATFTLNQNYTVVIVYKSRAIGSGGANDFIFCGATTDTGLLAQTVNPKTYIYAGTSTPGNNTSYTTFVVATAEFRGASSNISINGSQIGSGNAGSNNGGGLTVGASNTGTRPTQIDVAGVYTIPALLTAGEKTNLYAYINTKWAVY